MTEIQFNSGQLQLISFFNSKVAHFLNKNELNLLDIGYGDISIFEKISNPKIIKVNAIDPVGAARQNRLINYKQLSLFDLNEERFDLIFDSHALHTLNSVEDFKQAIYKVSELLKTEGIFAAEFMIIKKDDSLTGKLKLNYLDIEKWILEAGLSIRSFIFLKDTVFYQENIESEILQVVAIKK